MAIELTTEHQLAKDFAVSICTLRRWADRGKIPEPIRISRKRFWDTERLQAWIDEQIGDSEK